MCQIYKFCDYCGARGYSLKLPLQSVARHQPAVARCGLSGLHDDPRGGRGGGGSEINSLFEQVKLCLARRDT